MKKPVYVFLIFILLIFIVLSSGCAQEKAAPKTGDEAEKQIQTPPKQSIAKTEIKVSQKGMEMTISPSQNDVIKDAVAITVQKVPPNTGIVGFAIIGPGIEALEKTGPNLGYDNDGSDGWSFEFDTNSYPNNNYTIAAIAFPAERQSGEPPLGAAQAQVEIKNPEFSPVEPPANTAPYKVIGGSCQNPLESIETAKKLNANAISLGPTAGFIDDKDGAVIWEPPEKAAKGCAKLIALAHENSLKTVFGAGIVNEEDFVIKNFSRQRFIQTRKEMIKSYAAFAQQNKVQIFTIAGEIDSMTGTSQIPVEEQMALLHELSKELIKGVQEVYDGKIAIGLAGVEPDELEASYYPFEGASIICFSANELQEAKIEESLQNIRKLAALMKKTGQMAGGINEVVLCEVSLFPKAAKEVKFNVMGINAAMKALSEKQSSFDSASFQENEKEFYRRLISEVGPKLSGIAINAGPSGPLSIRGRLAEKAVAEEFEIWN